MLVTGTDESKTLEKVRPSTVLFADRCIADAVLR